MSNNKKMVLTRDGKLKAAKTKAEQEQAKDMGDSLLGFFLGGVKKPIHKKKKDN